MSKATQYIDIRRFKQCSCGLYVPVADCPTCTLLVCAVCEVPHAQKHIQMEAHAGIALRVQKERGDAYHA